MTPELANAYQNAAIDIAKQTNTMEGAFLRAFDNIGDAFSDMFTEAVKDGKFSFKSLTDTLKETFAKAIAEMAYYAIARPVIIPKIVNIDLDLSTSKDPDVHL